MSLLLGGNLSRVVTWFLVGSLSDAILEFHNFLSHMCPSARADRALDNRVHSHSTHVCIDALCSEPIVATSNRPESNSDSGNALSRRAVATTFSHPSVARTDPTSTLDAHRKQRIRRRPVYHGWRSAPCAAS